MHPVVHQAALRAGEEVDKEQLPFFGKLPGGLHVEGQVGVSKAQVRNELAGRFLKRRRRNQDDQARLPAEGIEELAVGIAEASNTAEAFEGLELAELRDENRRTDTLELLIAAAEAVLAPALDVAAEAEDRIGFPGQVTKPSLRRRGGLREDRLEIAGLLQVEHVGSSRKNNHVIP